jgi:hypothetical protein
MCLHSHCFYTWQFCLCVYTYCQSDGEQPYYNLATHRFTYYSHISSITAKQYQILAVVPEKSRLGNLVLSSNNTIHNPVKGNQNALPKMLHRCRPRALRNVRSDTSQ